MIIPLIMVMFAVIVVVMTVLFFKITSKKDPREL